MAGFGPADESSNLSRATNNPLVRARFRFSVLPRAGTLKLYIDIGYVAIGG